MSSSHKEGCKRFCDSFEEVKSPLQISREQRRAMHARWMELSPEEHDELREKLQEMTMTLS